MRPVSVGARLVLVLASLPYTLGLSSAAGGWHVAAQGSTDRALVAGRVVDPRTNQGIPNCRVTLVAIEGSGTGAMAARGSVDEVIADIDGRFVFSSVRAGWYVVDAAHAQYSSEIDLDGVPVEGHGPFLLGRGAIKEDLRVEMNRRASIEGRLTDSSGDPLPGVEVRARRRQVSNRDSFDVAQAAVTDDRGQYRISKLDPGEYLLAVVSTQVNIPASLVDLLAGGDVSIQKAVASAVYTPGQPAGFSPMGWQQRRGLLFGSRKGSPPGRLSAVEGEESEVFTTTFYVGARHSFSALPVVLTPGDDIRGVDFELFPARGVVVTGRLTDGARALHGVVVRLLRSDSGEPVDVDAEAAVTLTDMAGQFTFAGIPRGDYILVAGSQPAAGIDPTWVVEFVQVGERGLAGLDFQARPGRRVSGQVLADANEPVVGVEVSLERLDGLVGVGRHGEWGRARSSSRGDFTTVPVPPGKYALRVDAPVNWTIASITGPQVLSGAVIELDTRDVPMVVVRLTRQPNSVTGRVIRSTFAEAERSFVVLIHDDDRVADRQQAFLPGMSVVRTDRNGQYRFDGIPEGTYRVFAVRQLPRLTPAVLHGLTLVKGVRIDIRTGRAYVQDLRLSEVRR